MKHTNDGSCPRCAQKLTEAHPTMVSFFCWAKGNHREAHISWSFRNEEEQREMFGTGKSKKDWPLSMHNTIDLNGRPCAKALDIFQLDSEGHAVFDEDFYRVIGEETKQAKLPVVWSGDWKTFKETNHFELIET